MKISNNQAPRVINSPDYNRYMKIAMINANSNILFKVRQVQKITEDEDAITLEDLYSINVNDPDYYSLNEYIPKKETIKLYRLTNNIPYSTIFLKIIDNKLYLCKEFQGSWEIEFTYDNYISSVIDIMGEGGQSQREVTIEDAIQCEYRNCLVNTPYSKNIKEIDIYGNTRYIECVKEYKYEDLDYNTLRIAANVVLPFYLKVAIYHKTDTVEIVEVYSHNNSLNTLDFICLKHSYHPNTNNFELYRDTSNTNTYLYIKLLKEDSIIRILEYTNININGTLSDNISTRLPITETAKLINPVVHLLMRDTNNKYGSTEDRPTLNLIKGFEYFDTTLNKPIWWNGTKWVDATGADV